MGQVASRYIAAAAAFTAGGLLTASFSVTPSLSDVQVRDFDFAASLQANLDPQIEVIQNHVQQVLGGGSDLDQPHIGLGELLFDRDDGFLNGIGNPTFNISDTMLDQNLLNSLLGGGFDPETIRDGLVADPGAAGVNIGGSGPGGLFGADTQAASGAANAVAVSFADIAPAAQAAYQAFTTGLVTAELEFNTALVSAQADTAEQLFGHDNTANDVANWMFDVNNMMLAHNEEALNNLFGADFSTAAIDGSLLNNFDSDGLSQTAWAAALGLSPDDFTAVVNAAEAGNFLMLLDGIFPGLF